MGDGIGKKIIFLTVLAVSFSTFLFAQQIETREVLSLSQIDEMIERTEYNAALDELSVYMSVHPEDFDSAQKRVAKILETRREYSEIARQLIEVLETDEDGEEKSLRVLDIVAKLESLEKHPTDKNLAFIRQAKVAALFTVYRSRYFEIMNDGSALVKAGRYEEAGRRFQDGFVLYRAEFEEEGYPARLKKTVYDAVDDIRRQYEGVSDAITNCQIAYEDFVRAVKNENLSASQQAFSRVQKAFAAYAVVRNRIAESGNVFVQQFDYLRQFDPYLPDASFLGFARRFALGRGSDPDSGVVGALDAFWNTRVEDMKTLLYKNVLLEAQNLVTVSDDSLFQNAASYAGQMSFSPFVKGFSLLSGEVQNLYSLLKNADGTSVAESYHAYNDSMAFVRAAADDALSSYKAMDTIASAKTLRRIPQKTDEPLEPRALEQRISRLREAVSQHEAIVISADAIDASLKKERAQEALPHADEKQVRTTAGVVVSDVPLDFSEFNTSYGSLNKKIAEEAQSAAGELWTAFAVYCAGDAERQFASLSSRHKKNLALCDGTETSDSAIIKKYPSRAIELSLSLASDIASAKNVLTGWRETLREGEAYRASQSGYADGVDTVDSVIVALDTLLSDNAALVARARKQVQDAELAANEAASLYGKAKREFERGEFGKAREFLQYASSKYNESFSYQENEKLRASSDAQLVALGAEIVEKENEIVVRDVRALKKQAWNAYYAGNLDEADARLAQAKNRWAETNVEEDKEITNLHALVTTALSMKTGRFIPPTAPDYPEMSQILSIANQHYNKGFELMKQGEKTEAKKELNQAKEKLRNLLRVYPFNQESSLLNLRIDQLLDEKGFSKVFAQKIDSAKKDYKNPKTRQRAYADLLDLYEINPQYPGLKKLIEDVEIELGVRPKPVDRSGLVKSQNLTDQAKKIYSGAGRDERKLRSALTLVDEAISLNPNNDDAILLKDRIQIAVGGKTTVVLSSADEAQYQQAIQALQRGNVVGALALVEKLLQKSSNLRSAKILDLQKRLKDQL